MTYSELKTLFHDQLSPLFGGEEIDAFLYRLLQTYTDYNRLYLALHPHTSFSHAQVCRLQEALQELEKEKPIQYILGKTYFYGLEFAVNQQVLIPRPETEELVEWVITDVKRRFPNVAAMLSTEEIHKPIHLLDIGTGSGCIAIALATNLPNARVTAIDNSPGALALARENAERHHAPVTFIKEDIMNLEALAGEFEVIVSNPPYVRLSEKRDMKNNVINYEPHAALFVPDENPLLFYEKIAAWAKKRLRKNGMLYFECNQHLGNQLQRLLEKEGYIGVTLRKDLAGNNRMVCAIQP